MVFENENAVVPEGLVTDRFLIRRLSETDVELDYAAVMDSREMLRTWEQSTWPADAFTRADNLKDLQRHEREHFSKISFTYTVMNPAETECLGCIYIYPRTTSWLARSEATPIGDKVWSDYEAVIRFWVRQSRLAEGMGRELLDVLRPWFAQEWDFDGHLFHTSEKFAQQIATWEGAGLQRQFEIKDPKEPEKDLAYI